jgi:hypothetical protein
MLLARFCWFCQLLLLLVPVARRLPKARTIALAEPKQRSMVRIGKNGHLNQSHGFVPMYASVVGWRVLGSSGHALACEET